MCLAFLAALLLASGTQYRFSFFNSPCAILFSSMFFYRQVKKTKSYFKDHTYRMLLPAWYAGGIIIFNYQVRIKKIL